MTDHYIVFTANQGTEHRHGFLIMEAEPTEEAVIDALAHTADLTIGEMVEVEWTELTKDEYEAMRAETLLELGLPDITNMDSAKDKMN